MIGGLADWFAVTALFRHPLGIPIPHTAIIANRKDAIGASLGGFVESNFLSAELISQRLEEAQVVERFGLWLSERENAERAAETLLDAASRLGDLVDNDRVSSALAQRVEARLAQIDAAAALARLIDVTMDGQHHQPLVEASLSGADRFLAENADTLRAQLHDTSPWWVPGPLDDRVYAKISYGIARFVEEVKADPAHPMRQHLDARARQFADDLKTSAELAARGEQLKGDLLAHPELRAWTERLWHEAKITLGSLAEDDAATPMVESIQALGAQIVTDPELAASIAEFISNATTELVDRHGHQIGDLIAATVASWDSVETANRIEAQVGADLQFIRINGTVVGGLAGLAIYGLSQLL
jgi:uncharacterized membrane-anchored protein YjiN (DUF445 family)